MCPKRLTVSQYVTNVSLNIAGIHRFLTSNTNTCTNNYFKKDTKQGKSLEKALAVILSALPIKSEKERLVLECTAQRSLSNISVTREAQLYRVGKQLERLGHVARGNHVSAETSLTRCAGHQNLSNSHKYLANQGEYINNFLILCFHKYKLR